LKRELVSSQTSNSSGWFVKAHPGGSVPSGGVNLTLHPTFPLPRPSQNWVVISMTGAGSTAGLFGVEFDATWLGNGCSAAVATSNANGGTLRIGPTGGILVCPLGDSACTPGVGLFTGTNTTP